jgi:hypothetical protein
VIVRYAGTILLLAGACTVALWLWGHALAPAVQRGILAGTALAALGALAAMGLTAWSLHRSQKTFFAAMVLGILGRLVGYGAVLVYVALKTTLDPNATAAALLGFYVIFQVIEVRFAARRLKGSRG